MGYGVGEEKGEGLREGFKGRVGGEGIEEGVREVKE